MKLMNCDMAAFVETFGIEGVRLVDGQNVHVYLITNETAAAMNLSGMDAITFGNYLRKEEHEYVASMFFNVDAILEGMSAMHRRVKNAAQKFFCALLVHELVHVEQFRTKRLWIKKGKTTWEGKPVTIDNNEGVAYMSQPWEIEAYVAQFEYMFPGDQSKIDAFMEMTKAA